MELKILILRSTWKYKSMQQTFTAPGTWDTSENKISEDPALLSFPPSRETREEHAAYPAQREVIKTSGKVKRTAG